MYSKMRVTVTPITEKEPIDVNDVIIGCDETTNCTEHEWFTVYSKEQAMRMQHERAIRAQMERLGQTK